MRKVIRASLREREEGFSDSKIRAHWSGAARMKLDRRGGEASSVLFSLPRGCCVPERTRRVQRERKFPSYRGRRIDESSRKLRSSIGENVPRSVPRRGIKSSRRFISGCASRAHRHLDYRSEYTSSIEARDAAPLRHSLLRLTILLQRNLIRSLRLIGAPRSLIYNL